MTLALAVCCMLTMTGCSVKINSIGLPESEILEKGESLALEVRCGTEKETTEEKLAEAVSRLTLVWTSSDETVAAVDETGRVTAVGPGEADVSVSLQDASLSGVCHLTVVVTATDFDVPAALELSTNGEAEKALGAAPNPGDATHVRFSYRSSNGEVASVDENGVVTAVANGECDITVRMEQNNPARAGAATAGVVLEKVVPVVVTTAVEQITLNNSEGILTVGSTYTVKAAVAPDNATDQTVAWSSADESIATVDGNGKITAKAVGTVVITAKAGDQSAEYKLTVQQVKCAYCGRPGHTSANCPQKAADQQAAAAAAAQAAASGEATAPAPSNPAPEQPADKPITATGADGWDWNTVIEGSADKSCPPEEHAVGWC